MSVLPRGKISRGLIVVLFAFSPLKTNFACFSDSYWYRYTVAPENSYCEDALNLDIVENHDILITFKHNLNNLKGDAHLCLC